MREGGGHRAQPMAAEPLLETVADRCRRGAASEQEGAAAQLGDRFNRLGPDNITAQHMGWRNGLGGGGDHGLAASVALVRA